MERALLAAGVLPTPMLDTIIALLLARTVMAATKFGVFDALVEGPRTAAEVAQQCGMHPYATEKLLFALAGSRYLKARDGKYDLTPMARRWLPSSSPKSLRDAILHRYLDQVFIDKTEEFLRTGQPYEMHEHMSPEQWELYQRGQRGHAILGAPEVARRTPIPKRPTAMLDIGGAHGHFSAALCRRHSELRSIILDLPEAVQQSEPRIAAEGLGDRIRYRAGNALTADLGTEQYDLVFIANLVHHFTDAENRALMQRIARALRPGGFCVILEIVRAHTPEEAGQPGALAGFLFAVASASGTWSYPEMSEWQKAAGLTPVKPIRLRLSPGYGLQAARK
jgi:2-polyprenyl-3-methyl-5-hydroxy-6-metoxy-1,4-benzoquinol methylase